MNTAHALDLSQSRRSAHALALLAGEASELVEACGLCGVQVSYGAPHVCDAYRKAQAEREHKRSKRDGELV